MPSHQQGAAHLSTSADTAGSLGPAPHASAALLPYLLSLADDALVLGHRLSEWSGRGPTLEEDIALSNLALDLIGQARLYYSYAGELEGRGRDEDALAYWRDEHAYRNLLLLEQPNGDFAMTMARHLLYAAFLDPYFKALSASADPRLAEIGAKAAKEMAYHLRHAAEWVIRLGDGTEESRARTAAALDELWMYTGEMFEMDAGETALCAQGIAVDRASYQAGLGGDACPRVGGGDLGAARRSLDAARRPRGPAQRAPRPTAGGNAGRAPRPSRRQLVRKHAERT